MTFNSRSWILLYVVLSCFVFENNDCKKISEYFERPFLYNLNELNEFQRYVLCRYVVLLYDIMLRSWPPYSNLESEFLCHFPGPPMIICFHYFIHTASKLIFQVKKGQFSLVGFNWLFVWFNWLWVSLNIHIRIWFMFLNHVR